MAATTANKRLDEEVVVWLSTVDPAGTPQPTPVWYLWTGSEVLIFSQPRTAKLRNLRGNPHASVHLNSTRSGGGIVVLTGVAEIAGPSAEELAAYDEKYASHIEGLGMTAERFHASYSVPIRLKPEKTRGLGPVQPR
jgi:PPOX class probable F420-dependent enzyme